jgi:hypothetical protein
MNSFRFEAFSDTGQLEIEIVSPLKKELARSQPGVGVSVDPFHAGRKPGESTR